MRKKAFKFTVTVELIDPSVYTLDEEGRAVGPPIDHMKDEEVAGYIAEAVRIFGGQFAPGDPLFPMNIKSVRVRSRLGKIDIIAGDLRAPPEEDEENTDD